MVVDQPSFHTLIHLMPTNQQKMNNLILEEFQVQYNLIKNK
jgi:hypothetical protein